MNTNVASPLAVRKLGFWSAVMLGALFVLYTVCFIGILADGHLFIWTDLSAFLAYSRSHDQTLKYASYAGMLLLGFVFITLTQCVYEVTPRERRAFARLGAAFGVMFGLSTGINYFVQLTTVRLKIAGGAYVGLDQLIMSDPLSAMAAVNMLGWTFLLGISTLCLSLALRSLAAARAARVCLMLNAAVCVTGGVGFILNDKLIVGLCMYPLLGGAVTATAVSLAMMFRRMMEKSDLNHVHSSPGDYNDTGNRDTKTDPY